MASGSPSLFHAHTLAGRGNAVQPLSMAGSCQVLHHEEHDHTGQQHPANHKVLVLESPLLDEPHHCVGQAQHVGNVKDLLLSPLGQKRREKTNKHQVTLPRGGTASGDGALPRDILLVTARTHRKQYPPEIEPLSCGRLISDQGTRAKQSGKKRLFHKWCWNDWLYNIIDTYFIYMYLSYRYVSLL